MKKIVISAINIRCGGTLSVLNDFMSHLLQYKKDNKIDMEITLLCHSKKILKFNINDINIITYKLSIKSYFFRLYYEYIGFYFLSKKINPDIWFSLHDISPNVVAAKKFVYCHNPSPFRKSNIKLLFLSWKEFIFSKLYKYLYKINIRKNTGVIVQQHWIAEKFEELFSLNRKNLIVAKPNFNNPVCISSNIKNQITRFIYPSLPRTFKNFEIIFEAVKILNQDFCGKFEVDITITGNENRYAKLLFYKYRKIPSVNWIGYIERESLINSYDHYNALIFPSKIETFGMPIQEFKYTGNTILVSNLPYAYETIQLYQKAMFFDPNDPVELKNKMISVIKNKEIYEMASLNYKKNKYIELQGWLSLIKHIFEC